MTPLPMDEDISSLSAILLDDDYYQFLKQGTITVDIKQLGLVGRTKKQILEELKGMYMVQ